MMNGFGFSLKTLLLATSAAAIGLTALLQASPIWVDVIGLFTAMLLLTALVAAIYREGGQRAFWIGCTIFAWGYVYVAGNPLRTHVASSRLAGGILDLLHESLHGDASALARKESGRLSASEILSKYDEVRNSFQRIGQILVSWLFALIGGFVGKYFYNSMNREAGRTMV
jgi:hypothetical protein